MPNDDRWRRAFGQAMGLGLGKKRAALLADSIVQQLALLAHLTDSPDDLRSKVDLEFQQEFARLLANAEEVWYARAAAGVKAGELALEIGQEVNWKTVIKNAGTVAEANCDGDDEQAEAARQGGRESMRQRLRDRGLIG